MSDSGSVCSSHSAGSVSNSKMECPICAKEIQVRVMFNHIRKLHPDELLKNTSRKWIEEAENGEPLRVYWTKVNDFDEEEVTTIYVCLSTNKTFTTALGCRQHFAKDKKVLKDHNKQLKDLKKQYMTYRKEKAKRDKKRPVDPSTERFVQAFNSNSPDLARAYWRGILNNKTTLECCKLICQRREYQLETPMYLYDKKHHLYEQIPYGEFMTYYTDIMERINELFTSRCLEVKELHDIYHESLAFWHNNFVESILGIHADLRCLHPSYNIGIGDEQYYELATDDMPGVDF